MFIYFYLKGNAPREKFQGVYIYFKLKMFLHFLKLIDTWKSFCLVITRLHCRDGKIIPNNLICPTAHPFVNHRDTQRGPGRFAS